ncbi:DUF5063 domain-containing protein [Austwickia sp. TVS 96-490-7B]|uniref:DUF5063 domain-containing protein n=1 Tax=Austwickia sp. TVS 96-490-7B TaxID=2830843 RepID=UPI001C5733AD|nr:DUF5063 domain-containing protein [Austwickia sp. TVS 96-490-7B]
MPTDDVTDAEVVDDDLAQLGEETAHEARQFLAVLRAVGAGESPDQAIPLLLLATSQILVTGARLGAITDVVPAEQFEADLGSDFDVEKLRDGLAALLTGLDEYVEVIDPLTTPELTSSTLSGELTEVASALVHGLRHYAEGRISEALWWWQFSYLSDWGSRAAGALRALQSIIGHIRLDADEEAVSEAEFDALHR